MSEMTGMEKENRLRMEIEILRREDEEEDRGKEQREGVEGATDRAGTEEIDGDGRGETLTEGDMAGIRREMEQGKRRETGRHKQKERKEGKMETRGSIKSLIFSFTHSLIQSYRDR